MHELRAEDFLFATPESKPRMVLEDGMESWVRVGVGDCRARNGSGEGCLAGKVVVKASNQLCREGCAAWEAGCGLAFGKKSECVRFCEKGVEGWDWNYVECAWKVVMDTGDLGGNSACAEMVSKCMNVFEDGGGEDMAGGGKGGTGGEGSGHTTSVVVLVAFISMLTGAFGGVVISGGLTGSISSSHERVGDEEEEEEKGKGIEDLREALRSSTITTLDDFEEDNGGAGGAGGSRHNFEGLQMVKMKTKSSVV